MLIEIIIFLIIGHLAGTITGLTPGIHINLIGIFLLSASTSFLTKINPIYMVVLITSMAITHTFIDFIPSIFLGVPDTDTELSILPGHELLQQGLGYQAIILTAYGSLVAIALLSIISIPSILLMPKIQNTIQGIIPFILIIVSFSLVFLEKRKISALFVFILTGILGYFVLILGNTEALKQPLLPLLSGLFGASTLIISIKNKPDIPPQKIEKIKINFFHPTFSALVASPLCSFLPGLGSGQAAIIGNQLMGHEKNNKKSFLVLLGATNTLVMGFSFLALYSISKTRTGAAVAISGILGNLSGKVLLLIITTLIVSGFISFFMTIYLAKIFSKKIEKISYSLLSLITLTTLTAIIYLISRLPGLFVFILSTFTGIYSIGLKVRRTQMMGCLLVPTILFFLI